MRKLIITLALFFNSFVAALAQANTTVPGTGEGGIMEQEGKIYVVLSVCLIIFAGLVGYLFMLDRRISRMEQKKD